MAPLKPEKATEPYSDSDSSDSREEDEEGWDDVEQDEEETQQVISLLDDKVFPDVLSMLEHCKEKHSFDFLAVRQKLQLDFHGCVKLVNYIRSQVHDGQTVSENISTSEIESDQYLKPVLDDDAVIIGLFDLPDIVPEATPVQTQDGTAVDDLLKRNTELQEELQRITAQFERYRATVSETLDQRWGSVEAAEAEAAAAKAAGRGPVPKKPEDTSKYYWESYAGNDIHETMLKDAVRTEGYRDFIYNNKHIFAGKTVLDIGCGTGILSMFCAKAGAARVISVDASDIIDKARENVITAGLSSTITLVKGKMEEVTLPVDQVDIIVSEWMGYCLLYEAMLPSVLYARDRYLKPDGLLVPSTCNMWVAPVADGEYVMDNVHFWRDVYGFDMKAMQSGIWDEVRVLHWPKDTVCGKPAGFKLLDLYTIKTEDLTFASKWRSELTQDVDAVDGLLIWFDNFFAPTREDNQTVGLESVADDWAKEKAQDRVAFTTGPFNKETHWRQGFLMFKYKEGESSGYKKGDVLEGDVTFAPPEDMPRGLIIKTSCGAAGQDKKHVQSWDMR